MRARPCDRARVSARPDRAHEREMKLLVDHDLAALNAFLASVNVGDYVVSGQVESYSCA